MEDDEFLEFLESANSTSIKASTSFVSAGAAENIDYAFFGMSADDSSDTTDKKGAEAPDPLPENPAIIKDTVEEDTAAVAAEGDNENNDDVASFLKRRKPAGFAASVITEESKDIVAYVIVAGFHHTRGAIVEWVYSKSGKRTLGSDWGDLANLALPEGAHNVARDFVYFTVVLNDEDDNDGGTVQQKAHYFGVSFYEQIPTTEMVHREAHMTRSSVQKAVILLSREPYFGYLHCRLEAGARLFFSGKDFRQTDVLERLFDDLYETKRTAVESLDFFQGLSPLKFVQIFGEKTLSLLKLMLTEQRVVIYSKTASMASMLALTLASLIPELLPSLSPSFHALSRQLSLENSVSSRLSASDSNSGARQISGSNTPEKANATPTSTPVKCSKSGKAREMERHGLPLKLFYRRYELIPYATMNHLQASKSFDGGFLLGSSNPWVATGARAWLPVVADATAALVSVNSADDRIRRLFRLTPFERAFMHKVLSGISERGGESVDKSLPEPAEELEVQWEGGDDWIRQQFTDHFLVMLRVSARHLQAVDTNAIQACLLEIGRNYGASWYEAWTETANYRQWAAEHHRSISSSLSPLQELGIPSVVADVKDIWRSTMLDLQPIARSSSNIFAGAMSLGSSVSSFSNSIVGSFWSREPAKKAAASSKPRAAGNLDARRAKAEELSKQGYSIPQCWEALETSNDDIDAAILWLQSSKK